MKWLALRLFGLGLALGWACAVQAQHLKTPWPSRVAAPALEWVDVSGRPWSRDQLAGKVVVINFWASWCAPCLEELPSLQTLLEFSRGAEVVVLTVNVKDSLARIQQFVSRNGFTFPVVSDRQGAMARQWGVKVFPTSVLISPQGKPVWLIEGAVDWAGREAGEWVRALQ
jgi:thiol-disulfide isomerase/thioredoxin